MQESSIWICVSTELRPGVLFYALGNLDEEEGGGPYEVAKPVH